MRSFGSDVELEIYSPQTAKANQNYPISYEEWKQLANEKLEDGPYWYVAGGAGSGATMKANRSAFDNYTIKPRMLQNVESRDLSITLLDSAYNTPLLLAPIGVQSIIHQEGELASAKAASAMGVPYIASTASSYTLEEIASVMGDSPRWFQLYWGKDNDFTKSLLKRAENSGYSALVVTLDTPLLGWREQDLKNAYLPFINGIGIANYLSDEAFCSKLAKSPKEDIASAIQYFFKIYSNPSLTWESLAFLRENTKLPILLKGILHPEDALLAVEHGMDGIIVSNHGGRQVDGSISALEALPNIVEQVGTSIPILMDSGIRRGSDIIKALSLGAKAVLLGRPYVYGLAVGGEEGVRRVIRNLLADLDLTLALSGRQSIESLDRSVLHLK